MNFLGASIAFFHEAHAHMRSIAWIGYRDNNYLEWVG
jgi:hypothetical protein